MKTKYLLAMLVMFGTVSALVGCASTNRQKPASSLDEQNQERVNPSSSTGLSQRGIPPENASRKLDLDTKATVALNEWHPFDTNAGTNEDFSPLDQNETSAVDEVEILTQAPKPFTLNPVFGAAEQIDSHASFWDEPAVPPQGLRLFSFHF